MFERRIPKRMASASARAAFLVMGRALPEEGAQVHRVLADPPEREDDLTDSGKSSGGAAAAARRLRRKVERFTPAEKKGVGGR